MDLAGGLLRSILADWQESSSKFGLGRPRPGVENRPGARTVAEHERSTTLPEVLPTRLPTNYPHDWHLEPRCPHW